MMIIRGRPLILWARVGARGSDELLSHDSFTGTDDLVRTFIFHGHICLCVHTVKFDRVNSLAIHGSIPLNHKASVDQVLRS